MSSTTLEQARKNYKPKPETNRDRLKRVLAPFKGFRKWRKKQGEKKNRSQFKRYAERYAELSKIKNPNDAQKNQLKHAQRMRDEAGGKIPITGKGPVTSGKEYGKHLDKQSEKYKTTGKGPVRDSKEYGKTLEERKTSERKTSEKKTEKSEPKKSNVFTRHYKTGKPLGVMTRRERAKYDKEAAAAGGKSFDERVKATGDKSNRRETNYKASQRKKKNRKKIEIKKPNIETYKGHDPNTTAGSNKSDRTKRRIGN